MEKNTKEADQEISQRVGQNLRMLRVLKGFSQQALATAIGTTFQQIQKYESGENRLNAPALLKLAEALDCRISSFFAGFVNDSQPLAATDHMFNRQRLAFRILRVVSRLETQEKQNNFLKLIESFAVLTAEQPN